MSNFKSNRRSHRRRCAFSVGRTKNGMFRHVRADSLSAELVRALVERNDFDTNDVEDIIWGCVNQTLEQGMNIGRNIGLLADIPKTTGSPKPSTVYAAHRCKLCTPQRRKL